MAKKRGVVRHIENPPDANAAVLRLLLLAFKENEIEIPQHYLESIEFAIDKNAFFQWVERIKLIIPIVKISVIENDMEVFYQGIPDMDPVCGFPVDITVDQRLEAPGELNC